MKKILCTTLAVAMVMSLSTGCQKTPDTPVVIEKNQTQMLDTAQNGSDNTDLLSSLEVPELFTGEWNGVDNCVIVTADASITLPTVSAIPTAVVTRRSFTQVDADNLMGAFLKGNTLYEELGTTKQDAQKRIEKLQAALRGEIPLSSVTTDHTLEELPGMINAWTEFAQTAPDENDRFPANVTFHPDNTWGEAIQGFADVNGKKVHVLISNDSEWLDQAIIYQHGYGDVNNCSAIPLDQIEKSIDVSITQEDAIKIGNALMTELGLNNMVCDHTTAVAFEEVVNGENLGFFDSGYELEYIRTVKGVPVAYTQFRGLSTPENDAYVGIWAYERITIYVSENGVVYFNWTNPYTEPVIQTEDTHLLSFSDISDIFAKMIIVKNSDLKATNAANGFDVIKNIEISEVRLNLMRIRGKNSLSEGLLVPVWDFWGTISYHAADNTYSNLVESREEYTVALTVNAIDGTIIDRKIGY